MGKYYPAGATTNAQDGVRHPEDVHEALGAMEELGLVLSIHGEAPTASILEREREFLPVVADLLSRYPGLRIVLEHLSTREAAEFVLSGPDRLGATITAHHLAYTIDDLMGGSFDPHLSVNPCCRARPQGRPSRRGGFRLRTDFLRTDSAPHPKSARSPGARPRGSIPPRPRCRSSRRIREGAGLDRLEKFVSENGAAFYGLPLNVGRIRLSGGMDGTGGTGWHCSRGGRTHP